MLLNLQVGPDGETHIRVGKLNMVDLAGSERQAKTGAAVSVSNLFTDSLPMIICFLSNFT